MRETLWKRVVSGVLAVALLAVPGPAMAQDRSEEVIDLGEIVVEGKVQKPQVFYVLGRSEFRYKGIQLKRSFIDRIVRTAQKNPF